MPQQKTAITIRLQPQLLDQLRRAAARDNRTLTNYIETAIRQRIAEVAEALEGLDLRNRTYPQGKEERR